MSASKRAKSMQLNKLLTFTNLSFAALSKARPLSSQTPRVLMRGTCTLSAKPRKQLRVRESQRRKLCCRRQLNCMQQPGATCVASNLHYKRAVQQFFGASVLSGVSIAVGTDAMYSNNLLALLDSKAYKASLLVDTSAWAKLSDIGLVYSQLIAIASCVLVLYKRADVLPPVLYCATQALLVGPSVVGSSRFTVVGAMKESFARIRPPGAQLNSFSFPSGHVALSSTCVLASVLVLLPYAYEVQRSHDGENGQQLEIENDNNHFVRLLQKLLATAPGQSGTCVALIAPVACGRVLSHNHWLSDTLGGALLGASGTAFLASAVNARLEAHNQPMQ